MSDDLVAVQIVEGEDGEAVWVERCDEPDDDAWTARVPAALLEEFEAAHERMGEILVAVTDVSPRTLDGEWRAPCGEFREGFVVPAERFWQIRCGGSALWERFDSERGALDALARVQAGNGFVLSRGRVGGEELFTVVDTADWFVVEVDRPGGPVWGEGVCETCRFDRSEHGGGK